MHQVNLKAIYALGYNVKKLLETGRSKQGTRIVEVMSDFREAHWLLSHLIEGEPVPVPRSVPFAKILDDLLQAIVDQAVADPLTVLSSDDCLKLSYAAHAFEG